DARACLEQAIGRRGGVALLHYNLGTVLNQLFEPDASLASFQRAINLAPHWAEPQCSRALVWLSRGNFAAGWPAYEQRVLCPQYDVRRFEQPRWDVSQLDNRTLLVHSEQGLGDTLQFIRYLKWVHERVANVLLYVQPALVPLLEQAGYANVYP